MRLRALGLVVLAACASPSPPAPEPPPTDWTPPLRAGDPLLGRIYAPRTHTFLSPQELFARAREADWIALGETHDHPDHHRLQAWLVRELVRAGRRPALALEMVRVDRRAELERARTAALGDPDALGRALEWEASGWPPFALYRPLFAAALAAELPLVPADLPESVRSELRERGLAALPVEQRRELALEPPLEPAVQRELEAEIGAAHCGMADPESLAPLAAVQRARDAFLADAVLRALREGPVVLIAGAGHARLDRGVPLYLSRRAPESRGLAIAFAQLPQAADTRPLELRAAELAGPFDAVWFTPVWNDEDPCTRFKRQLQRLRPR